MSPAARNITRLALLGLVLAVSACGRKDAGGDAVAWLERSFRSGDIKQSLSTGERIAFSRIDGLRRRGAHVVEGMGIQYRFVRVEAIEPAAADLEEDDGAGNKSKRVSDELFKRVSDGEIVRVAEIHAEILPDRAYLQEHAMDLIDKGNSASVSTFRRVFILVNDGEQWVLARGAAENQGRRLLGVYRSTDALKSKVVKRELAERLVTSAPITSDGP